MPTHRFNGFNGWTQDAHDAYQSAKERVESNGQRATPKKIRDAMSEAIIKEFCFDKKVIQSYLQRDRDGDKSVRERYARNAAGVTEAPARGAAAPAAAPPAAAAPAAALPAAAAAEAARAGPLSLIHI